MESQTLPAFAFTDKRTHTPYAHRRGERESIRGAIKPFLSGLSLPFSLSPSRPALSLRLLCVRHTHKRAFGGTHRETGRQARIERGPAAANNRVVHCLWHQQRERERETCVHACMHCLPFHRRSRGCRCCTCCSRGTLHQPFTLSSFSLSLSCCSSPAATTIIVAST